MKQERAFYQISKREFMWGLLTLRTLVMGAIFLLVVGVASYGILSVGGFGGASQSEQLAGTGIAALIVILLIPFFGPIFGIVAGFDTISKERVEGTLALVLSKPVHKVTMLLGKFAGRAAAISVPVIVGLGLGMTLTSFEFTVDAGLILYFIAVTILLVVAFQALAQAFSTLVNKNATAILGAFGLWVLFVPLWGLVNFGLVDQLGLEQRLVNTFNPTLLFTEALRRSLTAVTQVPDQGPFGGSQTVAIHPVAGLVLWIAAFTAIAAAVFYYQDEA